MQVTTLTNLRNNLFSVAEQVKNNNDTVIVGKRGKKDFVILSFKQYSDLTQKKEEEKKKNGMEEFSKFKGIGANPKYSQMSDEEFDTEVEKVKYEHILSKHG